MGDADRAQRACSYGAKGGRADGPSICWTRPELVTQAWDYFNNVQTKTRKYTSFLRPEDKPAIWLNKERMEKVPAGDEKVLLRPDQVQELFSISSGSSTRRRKKTCDEELRIRN